MRLWIYFGAPWRHRGGDGHAAERLPAPGQADLDRACRRLLPIRACSARMPPWLLPAHSEFEGCVATYYDFTAQVPEASVDLTGSFSAGAGPRCARPRESSPAALLLTAELQPGGIDATRSLLRHLEMTLRRARRRGVRTDRPHLLWRGRVRQPSEALLRVHRVRADLAPAGGDHRRCPASAEHVPVPGRRLSAASRACWAGTRTRSTSPRRTT